MTAQQTLVLAKGTEVEVQSEEEPSNVAWFRATILDTPPKPSSSRTRNKIFVQYKDVLAGKTSPLKEYIDLSCIRPLPPQNDANERVFEENEVVDAAMKGGWWSGVVRKVLEGGRYMVYFDDPTDIIEFSGKELRLHWDWRDGNWVLPIKQQTVRSIYGSGESVEVKFEIKGVYAWIPGVVLKDYGDTTFLVKFQTSKTGDENGIVKTIVASRHIRPPPPHFVDRDYELLETVDIRHETGWRPVVVTRVLPGRAYWVFSSQGSETKEVDHSEMRAHVDWVDSKWVSKCEKALIVSDMQEQFRAGIANKMGTAKDNSDGKASPPIGIRKLIVKPTNSDERLTIGNSVEGPLPTAEPSLDGSLNNSGAVVRRLGHGNTFEDVCHSSVITGRLTSGNRFRIKEHMVVDESSEKQGTMYKRRRHTKSSVKSSEALVTDKDGKEVDAAGRDINQNESAQNGVELSLILGLEAKKLKNASHSYSLKLSSEKTTKPLQNGQKILNESAGDTSEKNSQLAVVGGQKRKRGRPRKLVLSPENSEAGDEENGAAAAVNNLVVEDHEIPNAVELPVQTTTEPPASNDIAREAECMTKEVDMAIVGVSKEVIDDDNRPLSTWFGGMSSSKNGVSSGKSANGWSNAKERQIDLVAKRDVVLHAEQCLPFTKKSSVWKTIETMEVFQLSPQSPHFATLSDCKEDFREGIAVGFMVIFAGILDRIASLQFDSSKTVFEGIVESLMELEKHGFDITMARNRVNEMLSIKNTHEELENKLQNALKEITEEMEEKRGITEKINAIEKKIGKLQEEVAACKSKIKGKDLQISVLKSSVETMKEIIEKGRDDVKRLASAAWSLP